MSWKLLAIVAIALFATGCTTTSDIMDQGNGTYMVTSAACPACGGTSKSASLAMEKANEYCSKTGKTAVVHNMENRNLNAVGAGGSGLTFTCAAPVSVNDMEQCYETGGQAAIEAYGEDAVSSIGGKVLPREDDFGFAQLSDNSYPTEEQKSVILAVGETYEKCQALNMSDLNPNGKRILKEATNSVLALMADLSASKITFGDYAKGYNNVFADLGRADAQMAAQYKAQRQAEADASMRASENLSREIRSATKTTNCTSTGAGSTVYTTCN